jgi:hypothetical protein
MLSVIIVSYETDSTRSTGSLISESETVYFDFYI